MLVFVEPGEHHLCTNWQSHFKRFRDQVSLVHLTAEAGHTYYFRMRATAMFDLEPVDDDEGQLLVAASAFSKSQQKK